MKISRLSFCVGAAALLMGFTTVGCGGGGTSGPAEAPVPSGASGVSGHALITRSGGPVIAGGPAPAPVPYAGTTLLVEPGGGGAQVASVTTDAAGAFTVSLSPGAYLLAPALTNAEKLGAVSASPQPFTVTANQFTTVPIAYSQNIP